MTSRRDLQRVAAETVGRPEQRRAMEAVLGGRDVLAVLPTGAGKSATYQVPAAPPDRPTLAVSTPGALHRDQLTRIAEQAVLEGAPDAVTVNPMQRTRETRAAWQVVEGGGAAYAFRATRACPHRGHRPAAGQHPRPASLPDAEELERASQLGAVARGEVTLVDVPTTIERDPMDIEEPRARRAPAKCPPRRLHREVQQCSQARVARVPLGMLGDALGSAHNSASCHLGHNR